MGETEILNVCSLWANHTKRKSYSSKYSVIFSNSYNFTNAQDFANTCGFTGTYNFGFMVSLRIKIIFINIFCTLQLLHVVISENFIRWHI